MKAITIKAPGGLDSLAVVNRDCPRPGPHEVLVRVLACSLNYHDYVVAIGLLSVADGRVILSDGAGEIVEVGAEVTELSVGDRVVSTYFPGWQMGEGSSELLAIKPGENVDGYGCEYVAVPANWLTKMPPEYSFTEAATLTCAGLTAWRGVVIEGRVKPGDVVLIQGTGGVSIFAMQFAKAAGATVIATTSSEEKLERLLQMGADHVINYREIPNWGNVAKELTGGRGVDLVIDIGGPVTLTQSITACRMNGFISLIGVLTGFAGEIPTAMAMVKQLTIKGMAVGSRADQLQMIRAITANGIKPVVDSVFSVETIADAYRYQEASRHFGKICVEF
jgi:NADPH:quinone reductase-like Zn-dependent oxidoreductase